MGAAILAAGLGSYGFFSYALGPVGAVGNSGNGGGEKSKTSRRNSGGDADRSFSQEPAAPPVVITPKPSTFPADGLVLTVADDAGVERRAEPVTSGIPMPLGAVRDATGLALSGEDGKAVPCDFTVLSRWPDGSAKWVLLDFQADCPADGSAGYRLTAGAQAAAHASPLEIREGEGTIEVASAGFSFTASTKCAGLVESVKLGDRLVVDPATPAQAVMVASDGATYTASKPEKLIVEHRGKLRTTVLASGKLVAAKGGSELMRGKLGYDLRLTAYAGKPYIHAAFTLKNSGRYGYENERKPGHWLNFRSLRIDLPLAAPAAPGGSVKLSGTDYPLEAGSPVSVVQWYKYPLGDCRGFVYKDAFPAEQEREKAAGMEEEPAGWYYCAGPAAGEQDHGSKADGFAEMQLGSDLAAGCAVRSFSENFPRGFSAEPDRLSVLLWPEGGFWPRTAKAAKDSTYQFEGGRHKTADMLFWFEGNGGEAGGRARWKALDAPLMATAPSSWYCGSAAVWPMVAAGTAQGGGEPAEAIARYERLQLSKVDEAVGDAAGSMMPGWPDFWGKVSVPGLWKRHPDTFQGWVNYGDLVWSHGYCALFYDWPYAMQMQYLRTGDRRFMRLGDDMAHHRYDIDQYHTSATSPSLGLFQRYEKSEHGNQFRALEQYREAERKSCPSHTWNRGPLLHWALTGDPRSLETAIENGRAYHSFFYGQKELGSKPTMEVTEFRTPGWAMENWLALYEYTGEIKYLAWADEMFRKTLLAMEHARGERGHILDDGAQGVQFVSYIAEPVCRLHHLTGSRDAAAFLRRVLDWQRKSGVSGGAMAGGKYHPICFREHVNMEGDIASAMCYHLAMADAYAYLYRIDGRQDDLDFSRMIFRDYMFYYGSRGATDPQFRTPLGFHYLGDPLTGAAKVHVLNGRYGQIYLDAEQRPAAGQKP